MEIKNQVIINYEYFAGSAYENKFKTPLAFLLLTSADPIPTTAGLRALKVDFPSPFFCYMLCCHRIIQNLGLKKYP